MKLVNGIPRRNRIDLLTPAEKSIYDAMQEVEEIGADIKLTDAVTLLQQARDKVADYIEEKGLDSLPSSETTNDEENSDGGIEVPKKPPPP